MLSRFIFFTILFQWLIIGIGWLFALTELFMVVFVQASPVWVWVFLRHPGVLSGAIPMPFFLVFSTLFCVFKYIIMLRALFHEGLNPFTFLAIAAELGYLLATSIYLQHYGYFQ